MPCMEQLGQGGLCSPHSLPAASKAPSPPVCAPAGLINILYGNYVGNSGYLPTVVMPW